MAPQEARLSAKDASDRAAQGRVESQDSQLVALQMHRLHGIGDLSSSPVDPLDFDPLRYDQILQQPRPPKVHQQHLGGRLSSDVTATATATASAKLPTKSTKLKSKSKPRTRPCDRKIKSKTNNPAVTSNVTGNKDGGQDKGLDRGPAANLVPPHGLSQLQPSPTNASNERVSLSSAPRNSLLSRQLSPHSTPFPTVTASAPLINTSIVPNHAQSQFNETIPSSLSPVAAQPASQPVPAAHLGHDTISAPSDLQTSQHPARLLTNTYPTEKSRKRRKNMDSSQSPTQSNEGRSYEQYQQRGDDLVSSGPRPQLVRSSPIHSSPFAHRDTGTTTYEDETHIEIDFSALAQRDTQNSVPGSLGTRAATQQSDFSPYVFGNPETPAPPRNPFQGSKVSGLMASSQLYKQTQYSSGIKGTFSPTSSRPSPDHFQLNDISPNPSPLKRSDLGPSPLHGTSSLPQIPTIFDTSPQPGDEDDPLDYGDIARSNISRSCRLPQLAPIETYKPVPRWDNREPSPQSGSDVDNESDEDMSDEEERRRQRVARKKAEAKRRLEAISFGRPSDEAIVPSTNKERSPEAQRYIDQCEGRSRRDSQASTIEDTQEPNQIQDQPQEHVVADSQEGMVPPSASLGRAVDEGISSNDVVPNTDPSPASAPAPSAAVEDEVVAQIPETSPARFQAPDAVMSTSPRPAPTSRPRQEDITHPKDTEAATGVDPGIAGEKKGSSIVARSSPPAPAFSTRARTRGGQTLPSAPATTLSTSPLSKLTTTPALSSETTPLTEESPRQTPPSSSRDVSSPAVAKANRQMSKLASKPAPTRRSTRQSFPSDVSVSTDELARSPSTSTANLGFEKSTRTYRPGRASIRESPASRTNSRSGAKIFAGMVFAISFQGKQAKEKEAQYNARMAISDQIINKVKQGGGKVLPDGFDSLFEFAPVKNADREAVIVSSTPQPDEDIKLAPSAQHAGFTALIADGHTRKVKYMQALALGLPCIHERWITTCLEKHYLVDWSDYLLCAGNSSFLGEAIKSRNLPPYDAATAKLSEVIQYRPRLLDQSRILLLMPRAEESKKGAYVFLARVLGASLSRVYTVDEARKQLKAREDAGRPFDWVYVVDGKVDAADIFTASGQANKKRKRKSEAEMAPPAKRVRALSDELVIQSLILGRLMEEEELATAA